MRSAYARRTRRRDRRPAPHARPARRRPLDHLEALEPRVVLSAGGGSTSAGLMGEYFTTPDLSGTPAFTRDDVRIDFDWDGQHGPGGSSSPGFASVGGRNFSVRWTGQVVPKFSETFTFATTTAGGVRFSIRAAGASTWTTLIDDWTSHESNTVDVGRSPLVAGQAYDVRMEYAATAREPFARLEWASASTPAEVIEPVGRSGFNFLPYGMPTPTYADAFRQGRDEWLPTVSGATVPKDSDGWPLSDAKNVVWEGQEAAAMAGTYLVQFEGKAAVEVQLTGSFSVGATAYGRTLPSGAGYDAATNTTTAMLTMPAADIMSLTFRDSQRTNSSPTNTGFSDVRVMRPTTMGGSTPYSTDTLFASAIRDALGRFTTIRYGTSMLDSGEVNWSDRTRPSYFSARRGFASMAWEDLVLLSNEIGKDMYLMIPMGATDDYITRLAKLIRYGSDGTNPYDSPQAAPVYPPLNPNLKVYLEWSNETWNWSYPQANQGYQLTADAISRNTREGQIINYDRSGRGDLWKRWTALRTVDTSTIFRSVWGDAAMGDRVRVLLEYQMNNGQDTAVDELGFIDAYFNNGDGQQHVANPHPVSYYIWGSGGAIYYDAANPRGYQTRIVPGDEGMESLGLAAGTVSAAPTGTPWTFSGNAGIAANSALASLTTGVTLGTPTQTLSQPTAMGYAFTVGSSNVAVYQLGRWVAAGNSRTHVLHLIRASDKAELGKVTIDTRTGTAGSFVYGTFPYPVELAANTTYYLLSEETNAQDAFYGQDTRITPNSSGAIAVSGAMSATYNSQATTSAWTYTPGTSGARSFGPVDLKFATQGPGDQGFIPLAPEGDEMAYVRKDGAISQVINFTATGTYAVDFYAAALSGLESAIDIYIDNQRITPQNWNYPDYRPGSDPFLPGRNWGRDYRKFDLYTSVPFQVATTGNHTIRIVGRGGIAGETDPRLTLLLDRIRIASVDAFFEGGIPSPWFTGPASYQAQLHDNSRYAQAYGLSVVAYEGSWGVGGDRWSTPLQNYAKYVDPRAKQANLDAYDAFTRSGGDLLTWGSYRQWENTYQSATYPLVQAIDERNQSLPVPNQNGIALPGTLDGTNTTVRSHLSDTNAFWTTGTATWNVFVPKAGLYQLTRTGGNSGGTMALAVDGGTNLAIGPGNTTLSGSTFLTAGFHVVMLKCVAGSGWLGHIDVAQLAMVPDRPTDLTATAASSSQINVGWVDRSSNETGFKVYRATDAAFTRGLTLVATTGPNVISWQDTGLPASTTYYYRVSATNSAGDSPYAEFGSARTSAGSSSGAVDFAGVTIQSYGGAAQDVAGTAAVEDAGATLHLTGNTWKKIALPYAVTANTVLEFDFRSPARGEVHAIGLDTDDALSSDRGFRLYGTQPDYGIAAFANYDSSAPGWVTYRIPVGQYFTGPMQYLTFANDHDVAGPNAQSYFRNVRLSESTPPPSTGAVDFAGVTIQSYGGAAQDVAGTAAVEDAGATLHLTGNTWKKIALPYAVTANTVLEFDFRSPARGEVHAIGLDTDDALSSDRGFRLYGTQPDYGIAAFANYDSSAPGWVTYRIPVGQYFTGPMQYLTFANDHDVAGPNAQSYFRNVRLSESTPPPSTGAVDFAGVTIQSYGGAAQDVAGTAAVEDAGATLHLTGNTWKKIAFPYAVTANTFLEFDFRSPARGEVHAIGLDTDDALSSDRGFRLYGTQHDYGIAAFANYDASAPGWVSYRIPVGQYFTGSMQYLTFANDHDVAGPNAQSYFRNVRLSESTTAQATGLAAEGAGTVPASTAASEPRAQGIQSDTGGASSPLLGATPSATTARMFGTSRTQNSNAPRIDVLTSQELRKAPARTRSSTPARTPEVPITAGILPVVFGKRPPGGLLKNPALKRVSSVVPEGA